MVWQRSTPGKTPPRGSSSTSRSPSPRLTGTPITAPLDATVLRLFPEPPARLPTEDVYGGISFPKRKTRPYVILNMVCSLDGKTTVHGKAEAIGSQIDRALMRTLRSRADAVMVGAGTLRAEKLNLGVPEDVSQWRASRGLKPQPLSVIATTSGDLPLRENLIGSSPDNLVVLASPDTPRHHLTALSSFASVEIVPEGMAPRSWLDPTGALQTLKERHAVDVLLVEGGPALNYALVSAGLADELFLTLAPKLLGGTRHEALTMLEGPAVPHLITPEPELISVYLSDNELFLRYALRQIRTASPL